MYYFDEQNNLVDSENIALTESAELSNDSDLDTEDKILLFEAMMRDLMNEDEFKAYIESTDYQKDLEAMYGKSEVVTEALRSRVKLSGFDEIKRLAKIAVYSIARKKGNKKFKKLLGLQAKARKLEAELAREYGTEAIRVAREQYTAAKKNVASLTAKKAVKKAEASATKDFFRYTKKM